MTITKTEVWIISDGTEYSSEEGALYADAFKDLAGKSNSGIADAILGDGALCEKIVAFHTHRQPRAPSAKQGATTVLSCTEKENTKKVIRKLYNSWLGGGCKPRTDFIRWLHWNHYLDEQS